MVEEGHAFPNGKIKDGLVECSKRNPGRWIYPAKDLQRRRPVEYPAPEQDHGKQEVFRLNELTDQLINQLPYSYEILHPPAGHCSPDIRCNNRLRKQKSKQK